MEYCVHRQSQSVRGCCRLKVPKLVLCRQLCPVLRGFLLLQLRMNGWMDHACLPEVVPMVVPIDGGPHGWWSPPWLHQGHHPTLRHLRRTISAASARTRAGGTGSCVLYLVPQGTHSTVLYLVGLFTAHTEYYVHHSATYLRGCAVSRHLTMHSIGRTTYYGGIADRCSLYENFQVKQAICLLFLAPDIGLTLNANQLLVLLLLLLLKVAHTKQSFGSSKLAPAAPPCPLSGLFFSSPWVAII